MSECPVLFLEWFRQMDSEDSDQTGGCSGRSESSLGSYVILLILSNIIVNTNLARNMSSNFIFWVCRYPIIDLSA